MTQTFELKANEKKVVPIVWTGDEKLLDYQIILSGRGSELSLPMLLLGKDNSNLILKVNIVHTATDTKSRVDIKGALDNESYVDFEGLVKIEKGAKGTDTYLGAHLLLLSDHAGGRAVPNMEIDENDVIAGHGATVGRLNDMELFYLMSRGLNTQIATKLIVQGFLQSLLNQFPKAEALSARKKLQWT